MSNHTEAAKTASVDTEADFQQPAPAAPQPIIKRGPGRPPKAKPAEEPRTVAEAPEPEPAAAPVLPDDPPPLVKTDADPWKRLTWAYKCRLLDSDGMAFSARCGDVALSAHFFTSAEAGPQVHLFAHNGADGGDAAYTVSSAVYQLEALKADTARVQAIAAALLPKFVKALVDQRSPLAAKLRRGVGL